MSTKALNCRQARWAELLANYDFVLILIPGTKNPADGPSHRPDYAQNVPVSTGSLIPPNALRLLPPSFTNASGATAVNTLFTSIVGVHAIEAVEPILQERIISSYPTDAVASQHISDPQHPWSCKDRLLLHKGLIYLPESPSSLHMDIL